MTCGCSSKSSTHWSTYAEGARAAGQILHFIDPSALQPTTKDDRNIATRRGFESVLRSITRELILITRPADLASLTECLQALDCDWRGMSPSARDEAIQRAALALGGVPQIIVAPVVEALGRMGKRAVEDAKGAAKGMYDLPISGAFDVVDKRVVEHAASSHALYIRDEYGRRVVAASEKAREVVSAGLEQGLDRRALGAMLKPEMTALSVRRSESYWEMVSSVFAARSRTWGTLSALEEAGIDEYAISATLDAASCDACRLMAEENFSVASAAARYRMVAASDDPEAVCEMQPFLGVAENEDGEQAVYFKRGDERRAVAQIVESAVGRDGERGRFARAMGKGAMEMAGISAPPFHPHCRCLCVPTERALTQKPVTVVAEAPVAQAPAHAQIPIQTIASDFYARASSAGLSVSTRDAAFDRTCAAVFDSKMPTVDTLERVWGSDDAKVKLSEASSYELADRKAVSFSGDIQGKSGAKIGDVTRTFIRHQDGTLEVHHDYFKIDDPSAHGKKSGEKMLRQAIQTYEQLGVAKVSVDSAWVGRYTWATFGYGWDAETAKDTAERLADFMTHYGVEAARASDIAASVSGRAWDVAALDVDGIVVRVKSEGKDIDCKVGKAFLLKGPMWSGEIVLDPSHETYQRAKKRIGL